MKTKPTKIIFFLAFALIFFSAKPVFAADAPVVLFSDMTDGPTTGWDGSNTKGAAVTIWGYGFGSSRGSSYVTVGGVNLTNDSDYAEWGATTNPQTASGQQRITFHLNSSMITGGTAPNTSISVHTANGISGTIPFHCRAIGGTHIYFLDDTGSDAGAGSLTSPWKTGAKVRATAKAGDIFYLRAGVYTSTDNALYSASHAWINIWHNGGSDITSGTAYNSVTVASYPGELAQIGDGDLDWTNNPKNETVFYRMGSVGSAWNYWTISKLKVLAAQGVVIEANGSVIAANSDTGLRFVGMDIRSTSAASGTGIPFTKEGGGGGCHNFSVLGNYIHQTGVPLAPTVAPTLSTGTGTGLTGTYNAKYTYINYRSVGYLGQESEMSSAGTPVSLTNGALRIAWSQPTDNRQNGDAARSFTHVRIYRTKAGGSTYFFDKEVALADGTTDSTTADGSLSTRSEIEGGYYVGPMYFGGYGYLDGIYVLYNEMYDCNGTAVQNYGHIVGDYCDNFYFANNYVHRMGKCVWNDRPAAIFGGGDGGSSYVYARNMYIYNNVISNNYGPALRLDTGSLDWGGGGNYYVYNNTLYKNATAVDVDLEGGGGDKGMTVFKNNIIVSLFGWQGGYHSSFWGSGSNANLSGDHNLWYGCGAGAKPSWDSSTLDNTNPQFINSNPQTYNDFRLLQASQAKDAGSSAVYSIVNNDFLGISRPQGLGYDIGAFEYNEGNAADMIAPNAPGGLSVR